MPRASGRSAKKAARKKTPARSVASTARERGAGDGEARSPFSLSDDVVESALRTGEFDGPLADYFGAAQYAELRQLARDASSRTVRGGPRVLIVPGIMGSKIGKDSRIPLFDNVYWVDPIDIAAGRLTKLALPAGGRLKPLGVMLIAYLKLKLRLLAAGFDAHFHAFDWRRSIPDLGRELKDRLDAMGGRDVSLVGHSMGGLVSRAAIAQGARYRRLIMLGTPNFGSFAPVQALRATYPVVRKIGWLDSRHTAEQLSRDVFSTFPGLIQMLPFRERFDAVDLYDLANWPGTDGLEPRKSILDAANAAQASLSSGRHDFFLIAGIEQSTTVGVRLQTADGQAGFVYEMSDEGDGTVPLAFARLPGIAGTWYVREAHGSLPNNGTVGRAVIDLLEHDATDALPSTWSPARARRALQVPESELRVDPWAERRSGLLSQDELRHLLDEVASPDAGDAVGPRAPTATARVGPGYEHEFEHVVVGRRRQHRIDLQFARGSVTEASTRAIALGVFSDVTPSGAARALDDRLEGAITEMFRRRMFGAHIGEVFVLPRGRHLLAADFITFVGLGSFDRFDHQALQTAAENLIQTLVRARIDEFATVLFGGGSGENPARALQNLLAGFFRGLRDADTDHIFRRIVLCEMDPERYVSLKAELFRLSSTPLFQDIEITFDEVELPAAPVMKPARKAGVVGPDPVYLIVRREKVAGATMHVRASLLTAGGKATIITGMSTVSAAELENVRSSIVGGPGGNFEERGTQIARLLLPEQLQVVLPRHKDNHLVIVHDAFMSRVPWEVLALPAADSGNDVWFPALHAGISHRYAADNLSVAKWLQERIDDDVLNVLLIVNPTGDLEGAQAEGQGVGELLGGWPGVAVRTLTGREATHRTLLAAFNSGEYDVIHYAGHAFFDPRNPERGGILCHRSVPLTGAELATLGNLPSLVFFNACESARMRGGKRPTTKQRSDRRARSAGNAVGLAEAFMRGGVANFLGTYWPVGDEAALKFAETFYRAITTGSTLGQALGAGRNEVRQIDRKDWADYVLYGSPDFTIKSAGGS